MTGAIDDRAAPRVRDLSFGTLFRIVFWAGLLAWSLAVVLVILLAFIAPGSVSINEAAAQSTQEALGAAPIFAAFGVVLSSLFAALGAGLLKLFGIILPLGRARLSDAR